MITGTSAFSLSATVWASLKVFGTTSDTWGAVRAPFGTGAGPWPPRGRERAETGGSSEKISSNSAPARRRGDSRRTFGRSEYDRSRSSLAATPSS